MDDVVVAVSDEALVKRSLEIQLVETLIGRCRTPIETLNQQKCGAVHDLTIPPRSVLPRDLRPHRGEVEGTKLEALRLLLDTSQDAHRRYVLSVQRHIRQKPPLQRLKVAVSSATAIAG